MKLVESVKKAAQQQQQQKTANFCIGKAFENYRIMQIELPKKNKIK